MDAGKLHPQLRTTFRFLPTAPVATRLGRAVIRRATRSLPAGSPPVGVQSGTVDLGGRIPPVHVLNPVENASGAALLWIHGGGMVIGSPAQDYARMASLCTSLRTTVVMATYRLSPEHPFPTPLDDCEAAWNWLVDHAGERGIDPSRIAIGGESAGGGLTAMLTNRMHDKRDSGALQPAAQRMFCPMLDERTAADRRLDDERHPLWNNRSNLVGWRSFLGTEPGSATVPEGSVPSRRDDLTGLAPAWIGSGTVDLFYEEDAAYARALADAGVNVTLDEVPGAPHTFEAISPAPVAKEYLARSEAWLAGKLGCQ